MSFSTGRVGVSASLADLGEANVSLGEPAVGCHGRLIEALGLKQEAAVQIAVGLGSQLPRTVSGREGSQARGVHLVEHLRGLAKGIGIEGAHDAFEGIGSWLGACCRNRCCCWLGSRLFPRCLERQRFGVARPQAEALGKFVKERRGPGRGV